MKRNSFIPTVLAALLCAAFLCACGTVNAPAAENGEPETDEAAAVAAEPDTPEASSVIAEPIEVYVTISNAGEIVVADKPVAAEDSDGNGVITLADALFAAHEEFYPGGASAGFEAVPGDYGTNIVMLWGVDNGGSYGYYINDIGATNLDELLTPACHITAYSYSDLESWSDTYAFFDVKNAVIAADECLSLRLSVITFDENWNPVTMPLSGAGIVVNGTPVNTMTDENGSVSLSFPETGEYVISAYSDEYTLVPPVCVIAVD